MKNQGFYIFSMFLAFMFAMFISVYSAIHFESMRYMNIMMSFMIMVMASFFLISTVYFFSEQQRPEGWISTSFFIGMFLIALYASKAVDATNMTKYSILYTILVSGVCCYAILSKQLVNKQTSGTTVSIKSVMQDLAKPRKKPLQAKPAKKETPKKAVEKPLKKEKEVVAAKKPKKQPKAAEEGQDLKSVLNYLDENVKK